MIPNDKDIAKLDKIAPGIAEMFARRKQGKCPMCGIDMSSPTFKDELSAKEFKITGYCQKCQDFAELTSEDDD